MSLKTTITYETDYYGWVQKQVELLELGQLDRLDVTNLIEEIKSLGASERRALISDLTRLYQHLLKWIYQPSQRSPSWVATINISRRKIQTLLKENPSLKPWLPEAIQAAYADARDEAYGDTGLVLETFPIEPPFTWEDAMEQPIRLEP
ncbi:MAG: DUF29 domain-containing protein [Oscillatoriales cyanobacterium]|nr:MAG: DUF29 domain-containing protein [Oscillatoriales cyanobacterium]